MDISVAKPRSTLLGLAVVLAALFWSAMSWPALSQVREAAELDPPADEPAAATPDATSDTESAAESGPTGNPIAFPSNAQVAVIRVEGLIYDFVLESLERRVERAVAAGASIVVIELHTPGGLVTSALAISKYLKGLNVPTLAWINNEAYSAGIMIASACDAIVMAPSSATGDCAPIMPGQNLEPTERAKALSPILAEFRDSAEANDYPYVLFHAMCVLGVRVYDVEHKQTGQRRLVNAVDYRVMVEGTSMENAARGLQVFGFQLRPDEPGAPSLDTATQEDRGQWRLVRQVHDGQTLLTVTQSEAVALGLARSDAIRELSDLQDFLGAARVDRVQQTWSESLSGWLTSPAVRAVLILALLLGAYVEFQTPGLGLPGTVALLALIALVGAPFVIGLAEVWHLVLLAAGFALLVVEIAVLPGFGIFGITGIVLMLMGLVLSVVPAGGDGWVPLPDPAVMDRLRQSALWTMLGLVAAIAAIVAVTRSLERVPLLNRLVLSDAQRAAAAGAGMPAVHVAGDDDLGGGRLTVGATGRTITPLHPTGRARFAEHEVDVTTTGQWLEPGQPVRIAEISGNLILVDAIDV